jgi:flagellar biosynthetic protein FliP
MSMLANRSFSKHMSHPLATRAGGVGLLLFFLFFSCKTLLAQTTFGQSTFAPSVSDPVLQRTQNIRENGAARSSTEDSQTASENAGTNAVEQLTNQLAGGPEAWLSPRGLSSSLQILLLLTVLSLAPAILLMTTCYVRIIVVFGLLKQALGAQQLPPSQVITSISLFITLFVMAPVWNRVYNEAVEPYTESGSKMSTSEAWERGTTPIREFMAMQIDMAENHDDVFLFYSRYSPDSPGPKSFEDVPLQVLLPAYMLSELKIAFLMGFKIYLPFLILDIVIASVTVSMGMMMLPPALISTPFKLLLFVLVDGWRLVVQILLDSFGTLPS